MNLVALLRHNRNTVLSWELAELLQMHNRPIEQEGVARFKGFYHILEINNSAIYIFSI